MRQELASWRSGAWSFGEKVLDGGLSFAGEQDAGFAGGRAGESGVDGTDAAVAAEKNCSGIGTETDELRKLVRDLVDGASEQDRIWNGELIDERGDAGLVFQWIARGFKTRPSFRRDREIETEKARRDFSRW